MCGALLCPTAFREARGDSDVDLFFDHPSGSLGLFELMEVNMPRQYPRGQTQGDVIIINVDSINPQRGPS